MPAPRSVLHTSFCIGVFDAVSLSFEKGHDSFEVRCDDREGERQVKGGIAASGFPLGIADIAMGVSFQEMGLLKL